MYSEQCMYSTVFGRKKTLQNKDIYTEKFKVKHIKIFFSDFDKAFDDNLANLINILKSGIFVLNSAFKPGCFSNTYELQ